MAKKGTSARLNREIAESLVSRGRDKIPTYTVQPRNLWRLWDFSTLPAAVTFGLTLNEPFDVSTDSGALVWTWEQRPLSEAEIWGQEQQRRWQQQRDSMTATKHATKKRKPRLVQVRAKTPAGYRWLRAHMRGAIETPEGFFVTDEEQWARSLSAADAREVK